MTVFGDVYSRYYDLLYKDKDYKREADYVDALIKKYHPEPKSVKNLLELGCGTGKHAEHLIRNGYEVYGVDRSQEMIDIAVKRCNVDKKATFFCSDIRNLQLDRKFDAVISLFHVMSYQVTNEEVLKALMTGRNHLKENGIFIFDFWYGPAVLNDRPATRVKRLEDESIEVIRIAESTLRVNENIVEVNYHMLIKEKVTKIFSEIKEQHLMRYFSKPELELFFDSCGLREVGNLKWLSESEQLDLNSWYGVVISRLK